MDFGVVMGLDYGSGAVSESATGFCSLSSSSSDPEVKQRLYGSGFPLKQQERSATASSTTTTATTTIGLDEYWRSSKVAKTTDDFSYCKLGMAQLQGQRNVSSVLRSSCGQQQQMLSFSSPKSEALMVDKTSQNNAILLPCNFPNGLLSAYSRNTVYNSGSLNGANMHGSIAAATGVRGPFTQSQWMELEHQALIYKYITANVPIPPNLLNPIRKAIESAGFSHFTGGLLRPSTLGWGSFHLGFSNNADPEPGRCRRTDGKKWRCSRDAVADQKYCERHMNRGRHRSRKPVEGQTGHSVAGSTTTTTSKLASSSSVALHGGGGGSSNSLAISNHHHQIQSLENGASNCSSASNHLNRMQQQQQQQNTSGLSLLSKENSFITESSREFGLVTSDSLLNFSSSRDLTEQSQPTEANHQRPQQQQQQHSLRHFIDDWPKTQPNRQAISWAEIDNIQSDRTQLSISIPMAAASSTDHHFMPPSSPPEKTNLSPLRLYREMDRVPMGLGVGEQNGNNHRQANWIPIAWENSLGGPLGEVLHHSNGNNECNKKSNSSSSSSVLNLMTEGWDSSPPIGSSPTGVLQKTAFGSLSNSSAGSSPRAGAENNNK